MARNCFFSFHYEPDNWRAATIRQIGAIEGNQPAKDNDWKPSLEVVTQRLKNGFWVRWKAKAAPSCFPCPPPGICVPTGSLIALACPSRKTR